MEEVKETQKELSLEELKGLCLELKQRNVLLETKLRSIDVVAIRLNYLLKIIENREAFPESYITKCAEEVMETMTIDDTKEVPDMQDGNS